MTDTTNEAIVALCERLRGSFDSLSFIGAVNKAIRTIEALAAERDAALGAADKFRRTRMAEGARQERAAIVADLRKPSFGGDHWPEESENDICARLADRYERGDHMKGADHD